MIIDTKKKVVNSRFKGFIISIIFMVAIVLVTQLIKEEFLGLKKMQFVYIFSTLYIFYFVWMLILDRYYIFYSDNTENIEFKYFPLRPLVGMKKSIKIPKSTFLSFETKRSFFNFKEKLTLRQQYKGKIASYPSFNINILSKEERQILKESLSKFSKK